MKIYPVSTPKNSFQSNVKSTLDPYLYVPKSETKEDRFSFKNHQLEYFGGFIAFLIALGTLIKIVNRNPIPKKVVEIVNKDLGLNRIKDNDVAIQIIKDEILYPMASIDKIKVSGRNKDNLRRKFKTGLLIACEDSEKAKNFINAFLEHSKQIGLKVNAVRNDTTAKKSGNIKAVHQVLRDAEEYHSKTNGKKCSIAYIGNLAECTNLASGKTSASSNLEKRLQSQKPGVLWVAWTPESNKLPYFYNNTSNLFIRLD